MVCVVRFEAFVEKFNFISHACEFNFGDLRCVPIEVEVIGQSRQLRTTAV